MGGGGASGGTGSGSVGSFDGGGLSQSTGMSGGAGASGSGTGGTGGATAVPAWKRLFAAAASPAGQSLNVAAWNAGGGYISFGMSLAGNRLRQNAIGARAQGVGIGADLGWDKSAQDLYKGGHQSYGQRMSGYADFEAASAAFDAKNTSIATNAGMRAVMGEMAGSAAPGQKPSDLMGAAMSGQLGAGARDAARYAGSGFFTNVGGAMARGKQTMGGSALLHSNNWQQNSMKQDFITGLNAPVDALYGGEALAGEVESFVGEMERELPPEPQDQAVDPRR